MTEQGPEYEFVGKYADADAPVVRVAIQRNRVPIVAAIMAWPDEVFDWFVAGLMFNAHDARRLPSHVREKAEQMTELVLAYNKKKMGQPGAQVHRLPPRVGG
ncbi:MAG TPA: hypothetical protein VKQ05_01865 [Gemmatimonadales bacterium]|nr:hypothetical protein [Gemmatimonadales bacterium]